MGLLERLFGLSNSSKGVPMASDPTDAPMPQHPAHRSPPDDRTYEVRRGDTLQSIARDVYRDAGAWRRILEANRGEIGDPPVLYPGMILRLP